MDQNDQGISALVRKTQEIAGAIDTYADVFGHRDPMFLSLVRKVINLEEDESVQPEIDGFEVQWLQKVDKLNLREDYVNFLDLTGRSLVRSKNLSSDLFPLAPGEIESLKRGKPLFKNINFDKRNLRVLSAPFSFPGQAPYVVQVATSLKPVIHLLQVRLWHLVISIPVVLIIASFSGRLFAWRILRPVVEITKAAQAITHEDLRARVRAEHVDEEMKYLVDAFNDMISRLEHSFRYITEFSSHVAHELKTPLAIIRGESALTLREGTGLGECRRVIGVTLEESERMLKIIEETTFWLPFCYDIL